MKYGVRSVFLFSIGYTDEFISKKDKQWASKREREEDEGKDREKCRNMKCLPFLMSSCFKRNRNTEKKFTKMTSFWVQLLRYTHTHRYIDEERWPPPPSFSICSLIIWLLINLDGYRYFMYLCLGCCANSFHLMWECVLLLLLLLLFFI